MTTLNQSLEDCRIKWQESAKEGDSAKMRLFEHIGKKLKKLVDKNTPPEQTSLI